MADDLSGLSALLIVAEKRSFTAAAAEMRVTPSAVSQTIRGLEERVGVRLLQRTTRSVGLTEAGQRFVAQLKPALEGVHEAFEALGAVRGRPAGTLKINVPRFAYTSIIAPRLAEFWEKYPEIRLEIAAEDGLANIIERGFDAGMRIGEFVERDMISVPVTGNWRMAVVGSPEYFTRQPKPKHPRDLASHDCINYRMTRGSVYRWEFDEDGKDFAVTVDGRLLVNDGEFMIDAALRGFGLAYLLEENLGALLEERRLVRVLEPYCSPFPGLSLYYPSRAHIAPKLQAFVDFFKYKKTRERHLRSR